MFVSVYVYLHYYIFAEQVKNENHSSGSEHT